MIVPITGKIDESLFKQVSSSVNSISTSPIVDSNIIVTINSEGGSVYYMTQIIDLIRSLNLDIIGYVSGEAYSAGFVILQACDFRIIHPKARIMMHYPRYSYGGILNYRGGSKDERKVIKSHNSFLRGLSKRTGNSFSMLKKWNVVERFFTANDALDFGLVDDVQDFPDLVKY